MMMSNSEICAAYRDAKDKKKQVEILAQLNDCPKDLIISILKDGGYKPAQTRKKAVKKQRKTIHPAGEGEEMPALIFNGVETEIVTLALTELRRTTIEKKAKIEKQIEALDILLDKCFASKNGETEEKNHGSM